jgi:hypothetical protein
VTRRGSRSPFEAIRTEGGLLPHDLLQRIAARDPKLPGMKDEDYDLLEHEREGEVVNRSWTRLLAAWAGFRAAFAKEPDHAPATTLTRERWLLPLFHELGFGRLSGRKQAFEVEGRPYAITHEHEATHTAVHLLGARVKLDEKTASVKGAAKTTPHGLVQDFLNRSSAHDWAIVTNGLTLRLLRDSKSITRQAYVEFNLDDILDGERYSEFRVLWLVCHESRFRREGEARCLLEQWFERGKQDGVAALDRMRKGVEEAIRVFGGGFLRHRDNAALKSALGDGSLDKQDYYRQLLRLVYRLIFLFVTEDRDVLLDPNAPKVARARYTNHYATTHLRALATRHRGTTHGDLWVRMKFVMDRLYGGCAELGLPAFGSFLWKPAAIGLLGTSALQNEDLLSALRMLVEVSDGKVVRPVAWAQVGADELGSVYESLLELHPQIDRDTGAFDLGTAAGHERKTTGSYYTPTSLVECLLDSALDPVLDQRCRSSNPQAAILELRVCDPACGSGHFLVAVAHRIARRLAALRAGDDEPSPNVYRRAVRDVVGQCIFGVDLEPMAVELCKVGLWLEAVEPGLPLSFLEGHIQRGNSLLGVTPRLLAAGIPDAAYETLAGDDNVVAVRLLTRNREERTQRMLPFGQRGVSEEFNVLAAATEALELIADSTLAGVEDKAEQWEELRNSQAYASALLIADAWCSAFVWPKQPGEHENAAPTHDVLRRLSEGEALETTTKTVDQLRDQYAFFHWHIAFPQVFHVPADGESPENPDTGWSGGFDLVLGNPPWEAEELIEEEFFSVRCPEVADARTKAGRAVEIARLEAIDSPVWKQWLAERRKYAARGALNANSGLFVRGGGGKRNTYRLFAELGSMLVAPAGSMGMILKTGIVNAEDSQELFGHWRDGNRVRSAFDFINTKKLFPTVESNERFCVLTISGARTHADAPQYSFGLTHPSELRTPGRVVALPGATVALLNPNDKTVPPVGSAQSLAILIHIYRIARPLWQPKNGADGNPWGIAAIFKGHLNSATASGDFKENTFEQLTERGGRVLPTGEFQIGDDTWLPLYEGKYIHQFNHRLGTFEGVPREKRFGRKAEPEEVPAEKLADPSYSIRPRYWLGKVDAERVFKRKATSAPWILAFRDICRAIVDARTVQACIMPRLPCMDTITFFAFQASDDVAKKGALLVALLCSCVLDFAARQKIHGAHLTGAIAQQLPFPPPAFFDQPFLGATLWDFVRPRVLELVFVSSELRHFAAELGWEGAPFRWSPERRQLMRCELDAAFFLAFGLDSEAIGCVMDSFDIVARREVAEFKEYRSKRVVLEIHERMARSQGEAEYQSLVCPPPADPAACCRD